MNAPNVFAWMVGQVSAPAPAETQTGIDEPPVRASRAGEKHGGKPGRRCTHPQAVYDTIAVMLNEGTLTKAAIAREVGVSFSMVCKFKKRLDAGLGVPVAEDPITPEQVDALAELVSDGMTVRDAADQLMIPMRTAEGIIRHKVGMGARELRKFGAPHELA